MIGVGLPKTLVRKFAILILSLFMMGNVILMQKSEMLRIAASHRRNAIRRAAAVGVC